MTARQVPSIPGLMKEDNGAKEALKVIGGILYGAFTHESSIEDCFQDSEDIFKHFLTAFKEIKKETHSGVEAGLKQIGAALFKVPKAMKECKNIGTIVKKVEGLAALFSNPIALSVQVGKNIMWHGISIYREVKLAVASHDHNEYFSMGLHIGYIIDDVFLSKTQAHNVNNEGVDFMDGFAHGLNPTYYDDAKQCIHDVSQDTIDRIVHDIQDLDWKHMERSVEDIQDIVEAFKAIIADCQTTSEDFQKFIEDFLNAFNPMTFVEAALKIIENPLKFYRMIKNVQGDIKDHDFFDAGDITGDFVGEVLHLH
jgi:hypothetical protein